MKRFAFALGALIAVSGCASSQAPFRSLPESYVGAPLAVVVDAYGEPVEIGEDADGARFALFAVDDRIATRPSLMSPSTRSRAAHSPARY